MIKNKSLFTFILVNFFILNTFCEKSPQPKELYWGFESGYSYLFGSLGKNDYLRPEPSRDFLYSRVNISNNINKLYLGIKPEFIFHRRFGVSMGFRFCQLNKELSNDGNYFYWQTNKTSPDVEYIRINQINQKSSYIQIPLELRYFLYGPRLVRVYAKVGAELTMHLSTDTKLKFNNSALSSKESKLVDMIQKPKLYNGNVFGMIGLKIGRENQKMTDIGFLITLADFDDSSELIFSNTGLGLQVNIQIPISNFLNTNN